MKNFRIFIAVHDRLNSCLQGYTVETKNARNSLPINEYPKYNVITERRASREERDRQTYRQQKARENDENGNANRRLSTGEKIDLDFLRIIANRSNQASPSNVRVEENEQDRDEAKNVHQTTESNAEVLGKVNEEWKKNEDELITENVKVSQDHMSDKPVNSLGDATPTNNEDVPTTHEHLTIVDDDEEKTDHYSEKIENSSEGLEGSEHVSPDDDDDKNPAAAEVAENESVDTREMMKEGHKVRQVRQEIAEKQEQKKHVKEQNGLLSLEDKEMEQQRGEDNEHEGQIPDREREPDNEKQHRSDEEQDQHSQTDREKHQNDKQTTENLDSASDEVKEVKTMTTDRETDGDEDLNTQKNDSPDASDVISVNENSNGSSRDRVKTSEMSKWMSR